MSLYRGMLDTNMLSALMRDRSLWHRAEKFGVSDLCASLVVAAELRFGAERVQSTRLSREIEEILARIPVLSMEPPVDATYGRIRAHLQREGTIIGPNDLWIAAHALTLDLTLVTANTDEFSRVPDLRLENWLD